MLHKGVYAVLNTGPFYLVLYSSWCHRCVFHQRTILNGQTTVHARLFRHATPITVSCAHTPPAHSPLARAMHSTPIRDTLYAYPAA